MKAEIDADGNGHHHIESLHPSDAKLDTVKATTQHPKTSISVHPEEGKVIDTSIRSSEVSETKTLDASRSLTVSTSRTDKLDESPGNPRQSKREPSGSESSMGARKRSSVLKHSSGVSAELPKSNGTPKSYSTASYQRKVVVSVVKTTSTAGSNMLKSSENHNDVAAPNSSINSRQKELSESSVGNVKDNASVDTFEHEEKSGRPKKFVKDHPKQSYLPKIPESTKISHTSDSKRPSSDPKDSSIHSKVPSGPNVAPNRASGECASPTPIEDASVVHNKAAASAATGKGEKFCHSGSHPSSKGNVASMNAPASSNVPTTLSDEEVQIKNADFIFHILVPHLNLYAMICAACFTFTSRTQ